MPRPSQLEEQRKRLLPRVARAFSELGYRRTTTAELARRCDVQENILYRLWSDKKAMYLAAIQSTFEQQRVTWDQVLAARDKRGSVWKQLLAYEAAHQGETGMYGILFDALGEADDADIRDMLVSVYRGFHKLVEQHLHQAGGSRKTKSNLSSDSTAWALIGLATVSNIMRELALLPAANREQMFLDIGRHLMSARK